MPKPNQTITLACMLMLLPLMSTAQTCRTNTITATTPTSRFTSYVNGTVLDKYTDLMWKTCVEGQQWNAVTRSCNSIAGIYFHYDWRKALQGAQTLNAKGGFAKYKDWHVPNIKELSTLVERQCSSPAINLRVFPNDSGDIVWSSSTLSILGRMAWYIDFKDGGANANFYSKDDFMRVRLVRGGQ